ncbi:MAG: hypothetical protein F6K35_30845 [Okeania sp. SIO2H7]|nr:hypothetical protein [Okeania sp. SIO2H7]
MNPTILVSLALLALMIGAGATTGSWGYKLGREALKGITQPDVRPTNSLTGSGSLSGKGEVVFLKEKNILANVNKAIASGKVAEEKKAKENAGKEKEEKAKTATSAEKKLPIVSKDRGVVLEVYKVRRWGNSLVLDVNLKNEGEQSVRFLYSFLNVTDSEGRVLSASTEDLPGEIPPNGRRYYGIVTIPLALLDDAKQLSLGLTDYPNQQLQLKMSGIPVKM